MHSKLPLAAAMAAANGSFERCLLLVGAAATLREKIGVPHQRSEQSRWAARFEPARRALGESRSGSLLQDGRGMSADQATAYVLDDNRDLPVDAEQALDCESAEPTNRPRSGR